jgi:hypothetical protein
MTPNLENPLWKRVSAQELEIVKSFVAERPVKVAALANALGLSVNRAPMAPNISGLIRPSSANSSDAPAGYEIQVNKYDSPERQRFTVAHELGHFLLHRSIIGAGVTDTVLFRSELSSNVETEANKIAADIIMPAALVEQDLVTLNNVRDLESARELSEKYKVSEAAMRIRIGL